MKAMDQPESDRQPCAASRAGQATPQKDGLAIADNGMVASAERRVAGAIHTSPRLVAQRAQLSCMFGKAALFKDGPEDVELFQGRFEALRGKTAKTAPAAAPGPVVQHKKTTKPNDRELIDTFTVGHTLPSAVLSSKVTDSEKGDAIWAHLTSVYNTNKGNGRRYWGELTTAITDYKNVDKKATVVGGNTGKRTGYDSRFGSNYSNTVESLGGTSYRVNTKGYDSVKPVVPTGKYKGNYSNEFDVTAGTIKAAKEMVEAPRPQPTSR